MTSHKELKMELLIIGAIIFFAFIAFSPQHAIQIFLAGMWGILMLGTIGSILIGLFKMLFN